MSSGPAARQKTAILLDGGFVYYRFAHTLKQRMVAADVPPLAQGLLDPRAEELFRIYFYDCTPNTSPCVGVNWPSGAGA